MELGEYALDNYLAEHVEYFAPKQLLQMFLDCTQALEYLHIRGLAHRDFSTKNLLVVKKNDQLRLKLCDFGVSVALEGKMASTQIGTPQTMAPEIFDAQGYGPKADVWAAGCVCYELFTRRPLFSALNYLALINNLDAFVAPTFPEEVQQVYSISFAAFVMELLTQMLQKDPQKRIESSSLVRIIRSRMEANEPGDKALLVHTPP